MKNTKVLNKSFYRVKTQKITKITIFKPNVEALDINWIGQNFRFLLLRSKYISKKKSLKIEDIEGQTMHPNIYAYICVTFRGIINIESYLMFLLFVFQTVLDNSNYFQRNFTFCPKKVFFLEECESCWLI